MRTIETLAKRGDEIPANFRSRKNTDRLYNILESYKNGTPLQELDISPEIEKSLLEVDKLALLAGALRLLKDVEGKNEQQLTPLGKLAEEGHLTLAIIKPLQEKPNLKIKRKGNLPLDEDEARNTVLKKIKEKAQKDGKRVIFDIDVKLTETSVEKFYSELKERLTNEKKPEIWEKQKKFMQSEPVTIVIIYDPEGKAIPWWRNTMGPTNPRDAKDIELRGEFGEGLPNNALHGSDSIQSFKKEVEIIRKDVICDFVHSLNELAGLVYRQPEKKSRNDTFYQRSCQKSA